MTTARTARVGGGTGCRQDGLAGSVYRDLWGDTRHIGIFEHAGDTVHDAMARVTERLGHSVQPQPDDRILTVGSGHGAVARHLAAIHGCRVVATDITDLDLTWGKALTQAAGLSHRVSFGWADLHRLPYENCSFDIYWAQECLIQAHSKHVALEEAARVLKPGGRLVLTDLVVRRMTTPDERAAIARHVSWPEMWDSEDYRLALHEAGFAIDAQHDWSDCITTTYERLSTDLQRRRRDLEARMGRDAVAEAAASLRFWIDAAEDDRIGWMYIQARRL